MFASGDALLVDVLDPIGIVNGGGGTVAEQDDDAVGGVSATGLGKAPLTIPANSELDMFFNMFIDDLRLARCDDPCAVELTDADGLDGDDDPELASYLVAVDILPIT